jgi:hypothetical protein
VNKVPDTTSSKTFKTVKNPKQTILDAGRISDLDRFFLDRFAEKSRKRKNPDHAKVTIDVNREKSVKSRDDSRPKKTVPHQQQQFTAKKDLNDRDFSKGEPVPNFGIFSNSKESSAAPSGKKEAADTERADASDTDFSKVFAERSKTRKGGEDTVSKKPDKTNKTSQEKSSVRDTKPKKTGKNIDVHEDEENEEDEDDDFSGLFARKAARRPSGNKKNKGQKYNSKSNKNQETESNSDSLSNRVWKLASSLIGF